MSAVWWFARGIHRIVQLRRRLRGPMLPSWDARYETLAMLLHHYARRSTWLPLSLQRKAATAFLRPTPATRQCQFRPVRVGPGSIAAEWFHHDQESEGVLLYLHGGGYSIGSIDTHRDFIARLSQKTRVTGFAVDYRLAPEHPFPAAVDDALEAYRHVLAHGHPPDRVVIAGESAGGGLTLALLLRLRDLGEAMPAAAAVISPWVDLEMTGSTVDPNTKYDFLNRKTLEAYARRYVGDHQRRDPLASPLHADMSGLPPLLVHAGGAEALCADATRIIERAKEHGVEVVSTIYPEMIHAFHLFGDILPEGEKATAEVADFLRAKLDEAS